MGGYPVKLSRSIIPSPCFAGEIVVRMVKTISTTFSTLPQNRANCHILMDTPTIENL